jgi:hypothetical protein
MESVNVFFIFCLDEWIALINLIDWCLTPLSAIFQLSWRPVLGMGEARGPGENNQPWASNW